MGYTYKKFPVFYDSKKQSYPDGTLINIEAVINLFKETFAAMDLFFYGLAIYEGYKISVEFTQNIKKRAT